MRRRTFARNRVAAVYGAILLVGLGRLALTPLQGIPRPAVVDEFSYLFMADTFAAGRLTNPPHPLWRELESPFVLWQPTHASVYPVAQGLILAAAKVCTGVPWLGVVACAALMCGGICWMLQGWFPAQWAVLGTLLAIFQFGVNSYWINSYWGGAHAALGGALVLGAMPRLAGRGRVRDSVLLGIGLAILAASRPYEGGFLAAAAVGWLLWRLRGNGFRILLPAALVVAVCGAGMLYYFFRVTGNPLRMPNQLYIEQYAVAPTFIWEKLRPEPDFRHEAIRRAMLSFVPDYERYSSAAGLVRATASKIAGASNFVLGPLTILPLVMLPWTLRDKRMRPLLLCCAAVFFAIALVVPFQPHYAAPAAAAIVALAVQCLRRLWAWGRYGNPVGWYLVPAAPVLLFGMLVLGLGSPRPASPLDRRAALDADLRKAGGQHLVFIHYGGAHPLGIEWVHNSPDIDRERVVWAYDEGSSRNSKLMRYFSERKVWLVDPNEVPLKVERLAKLD